MVLIHLAQIKDGALHLEGEEEDDILDLPSSETIRQVGPVRYCLDVGQSGSGVWVTGRISATVELECVRCLARFEMPIAVNEFAVQFERPSVETIDLTPNLREDILLVLPSYPDCQRDGGRECPARCRPAPEKGDPVGAAPEDGGEQPGPWGRLDDLKFDGKGS